MIKLGMEAGVVVLTGLGLALVANALAPRGLSLTRDYFPRVANGVATSVVASASTAAKREAAASPPTNSAASAAIPELTPHIAPPEVKVRLQALGLALVGLVEVTSWYHDPRREQELILFVDARNEAQYQEGHVPGAYLFDRYYPNQYLPTVLPACQHAEVVIVYCEGGDCEDSEFAALALAESGIARERLQVYGGGMAEWRTNGLPVEVGSRGSGELREGKP